MSKWLGEFQYSLDQSLVTAIFDTLFLELLNACRRWPRSPRWRSP
jgi:hypothetical protein